MQTKSPFTAAIINFFFWGLGYVFCGKKHFFGYLVFIAFLFVHLPILYGENLSETPGVFYSIGHLLLSLAFAFDVIKPIKIKDNEKKASITGDYPVLTK